MDWQTLADGLRSWFAQVSGIALGDVVWFGEPIGHREYPMAELQLRTHGSVGTDEIRNAVEGDVLGAEAIGLRTRTLSCRVTTRDQTPNGKAYVYLERVRDRLDLPASEEAFRQLGIGLQGVASLTDLSVVRTLREESEAVLDILLNAVSSETDTVFDRGTIEHVEHGGTAKNVQTVITVPDQITPPLP